MNFLQSLMHKMFVFFKNFGYWFVSCVPKTKIFKVLKSFSMVNPKKSGLLNINSALVYLLQM